MSAAEILAALAEYDPEIEWSSEYDDGNTPFVYEGERVEWEVHDGYIIRREGCYTQEADFIEPYPLALLMTAMDAASVALGEALRMRESGDAAG